MNFQKVKVLRKEKDGLYLEFDNKDIPDIPISKTYAQKVLEHFSEQDSDVLVIKKRDPIKESPFLYENKIHYSLFA